MTECRTVRDEARRFCAHLGFEVTKSQAVFARHLPIPQTTSSKD